LKQFKGLQVIGGKDCASVTKTPAHGEEFKIGDRILVKALHTPCHTQDSICYYMQDGDQRVVFTGDTLFIGGMYIMISFFHLSIKYHRLILN
jgi:hydroxyacylglutathione hydrolase